MGAGSLRFPEAPHVDFLRPFVVPPESRPRVPASLRKRFVSLARHMADQADEGGDIHGLLPRLFFLEIMALLLSIEDAATPSSHERKEMGRALAPAVELVNRSRRSVAG